MQNAYQLDRLTSDEAETVFTELGMMEFSELPSENPSSSKL